MTAMIRFLAEKLHSLNPLLLDIPPLQEGSDTDECYSTISCGELPHGMRPNIASWYLSPEHHIIDAIFVSLVAGGLLRWLQSKAKSGMPGSSNICHPVWVKPVSIACWLIIIAYKLQGSYLSKLYYMVMPCNMLWSLVLILTSGPLQWRPAALQLLCTFIGLAAVALSLPDTKDCVLFGEAAFFFINHSLLLLVPFAYLWNGSVTMRTSLSTHIHWWASACCWFGVFYFTIGTVFSVISGLNLNYMMNPPPNQDVVVGFYYRYMSTALCAIQFALARVFMWALEVAVMGPLKKLIGESSNKRSKKGD